MATARKYIERIMTRSAAVNGDSVLFAAPATEAEITSLELRIDAALPRELRDIYLQFNGVGLSSDDCETIWWLVPLENISVESTEIDCNLAEVLDEHKAEGFFFGDWYNGDVFGYVRLEDETFSEATLHFWDHETMELSDTEMSLLGYLDWIAQQADAD